MSREQLFAQLVTTLEELFETPPGDITEDARLYDDLDIDSIDTMDLLLRLKQLKGNQLDPERFREVRTIGDVLDILEALD